MTLPPKALNVLVNIKRELLKSEPEQSVIITLRRDPEIKVKSTFKVRHARRPNAFQRMCHRRDWAAPIF